MLPTNNIMTQLDAILAVQAFETALAIGSGMVAMARLPKWARVGTPEEDEVIVACHTYNLEKASDATYVGTIECLTHQNLRDQMTVEEAIDKAREIELRSMPNRN